MTKDSTKQLHAPASPSLAHTGRDLCASLLREDLDQTISLLIDHANRIEFVFSDETKKKLLSDLRFAPQKDQS